MKSDARLRGHPSIYRQQMAGSDARFSSIDEDTRQPLPEVDILADIEMAVGEDLRTPPHRLVRQLSYWIFWRSQGELNPCFSLERAAS